MVNDELKLLIDGKLIDGDMTMDVVNPATAEPVTTACPRASERQLNQAVAAAKKAFPAWSSTPIEERKAALMAIADGIDAKAEELATVITQEQGKPFGEALREVGGTSGFFRYSASLDIPVQTIEKSADRHAEAHRLPLGVVGLIVPWNFPLMLISFKLPVALLAGNSIVLKPAPTTPLCALMLAEIIADKVPAGVVNVIVDNNDLGPLLTAHPDVRKVSFTGSTAVGKSIMASSASTLKRLTLELGGNDAGIVLDDIDVAAVAMPIFMGGFYNSGQICVATKRLYVHDSVYDDLVAALAEIAANIPVGEGFQEGVALGPVQNKKQYNRVKELIEDARSVGTVLDDGPLPEGDGYFIRPTIIRDISDGTRIVDEEQFGPVLPIIRYTELDDAIARANNCEYGLACSVWSSDVERAKEVASKIEAGTVWINKQGDMAPHIPLAGMKMSGVGVELGQQGLEEYTQLKVINA